MTRKDLISSPAYWMETCSILLYRAVMEDLEEHPGKSLTDLCNEKGINSNVMREFLIEDNENISLFDFINATLKLGKVPKIEFINIKNYK